MSESEDDIDSYADELAGREREIFDDPSGKLADRLFMSKQEAFGTGFELGAREAEREQKKAPGPATPDQEAGMTGYPHDWDGDPYSLLPHADDLGDQPDFCDRLFADKHEAYGFGLLAGAWLDFTKRVLDEARRRAGGFPTLVHSDLMRGPTQRWEGSQMVDRPAADEAERDKAIDALVRGAVRQLN